MLQLAYFSVERMNINIHKTESKQFKYTLQANAEAPFLHWSWVWMISETFRLLHLSLGQFLQ